MELREWIAADLGSLWMRLSNGVISLMPPERMAERVDGGGIAPVYVLWHAARHQDVAVNGVLRGTTPVLDQWADRVGIDGDKVRIQYASKYASTSNYYKKWIGENRGLKRLRAAKYDEAVDALLATISALDKGE